METDVSVKLLPIFKEKICDCIGIVCKMSEGDRVQAVQFWNQVSLRLQTVLNRTVNVTEKNIFSLDLQDKDGSCKTTFLINKDISLSLIPPSVGPGTRSQSAVCILPTFDNTTHEQTASLIPISEAVTLSGVDAKENNINEKQLLVEQVNNFVDASVDITDSVVIAEATLSHPDSKGTLAEADEANIKSQGVEDDLDHNYHELTVCNNQDSSILKPTKEHTIHFITDPDLPNDNDSFEHEPGQSTTLETSEYVIHETGPNNCEELQPVVENVDDHTNVDESHGEGLQIMELAVTDEGHIVFDNCNDDDDGICDTISTQIIIEQNEESDFFSEFKCIQCSALLPNFEELANHSKDHKKPFVCETCHQGFSTKGSLTVHQRRHNGDKPYKCDTCHQNFSTPGNLKRHSRTHTGEKPFTCDECQAKFTSNKNLKSHMLIHSGEKPYSCAICNSKFTQSSTLKSHMKIHAEEKPFACDICNKTFVQKSNMTSHRIRHSIERHFGCDFCENRFHTKADLLRHACSHLAGAAGAHINLFPCGMCNKSFSRNYLLNNHTHKEHKKYKSWQCNICKCKFFSRCDVVDHLLASKLKAGHKEALGSKDINNYLIQNQFILNLKAKNTKMELSTDIPPD